MNSLHTFKCCDWGELQRDDVGAANSMFSSLAEMYGRLVDDV